MTGWRGGASSHRGSGAEGPDCLVDAGLGDWVDVGPAFLDHISLRQSLEVGCWGGSVATG